MKVRIFLSFILVLILTYIAFPLSAQESIKPQPVAGAIITKIKACSGENSGPSEKTQFDVILKPAGRAGIKTNNKGIFSIIISPEQFNKLPDEFFLKMIIIPPKGWTGISSSNEVTVKVKKSDGPKYIFVLLWQTEGELKVNKGAFAVNAKGQA